MPANHETGVLLRQMANGDKEAADIVMPRIYDELRSLSAKYLGSERDITRSNQLPLPTKRTCGSSINRALIGRIVLTF